MSPDTSPSSPPENALSATVERRLAIPVLVSALVSVPAMFLDMWGQGAWASLGRAVGWIAGIMLWIEWALLFVLADNRRAWLRRNWWLTVVAGVTVPAVVFAIGPSQVLRLVHLVGTLRLLRVTRIIQAGGMMRERLRLKGPWGTAVVVVSTGLAAVFVTAVLSDPTSATRQLLEGTIEQYGWWPTALAGALTLGAGTVVVRNRWRHVRDLRREKRDSGSSPEGSHSSP
ncbi:metal-sensitive transcriptional repressor family protein [Nocardiopsis sp. CNT312]|uniref:metal-sensitive transcriptional repressor family protein n=1 Tax=Nocardiopsis sp. CNT312 TaxID=1137268 RepID=UPI0004B1AD18|nr:metal-sensitive transcriptional repressor family protein [Nocardiopsis sp. CNT312]